MFGLILEPEAKQLIPFYGAPVCLLMKDGSRKIGQLTSCASGRVILNGDIEGGSEATVSRKARVRRNGRTRARKPQETPETQQSPQQEGGWGGMPLAQMAPQPMFPSLPRESVPLKSVDSILLL